jgi:hypothetical protein
MAEPGAEGLGLAHLSDAAPGLQEGLLGQVVGQCGVAAEAPHQVADPGLAPLHEFGKGFPLAGPGQADEQGFGRVGIVGRCGRHEIAACGLVPTITKGWHV